MNGERFRRGREPLWSPTSEKELHGILVIAARAASNRWHKPDAWARQWRQQGDERGQAQGGGRAKRTRTLMAVMRTSPYASTSSSMLTCSLNAAAILVRTIPSNWEWGTQGAGSYMGCGGFEFLWL